LTVERRSGLAGLFDLHIRNSEAASPFFVRVGSYLDGARNVGFDPQPIQSDRSSASLDRFAYARDDDVGSIKSQHAL
jgi:hypothetical protein